MKINNLNYMDILKNINLNISKNSIISISGTNRCGKTTLMKILGGIIDSPSNLENCGLILSENLFYINNSVEKELLTVYKIIDEVKKENYKRIIKLLDLNKYLKENPNYLDFYHSIMLKLALIIFQDKEIILVDDIMRKLSKKEKETLFEIFTFLKEDGKTIVFTTTNLEDTLISDYLYILNTGRVVLEGRPISVLREDSLLNKIGIELPFMIDLSLKLMYYDLLDGIELDMDRMVEALWK